MSDQKYTYSFHYDAEGAGCTTIGNYLESDVNLHERLVELTKAQTTYENEGQWRELCQEERKLERACIQQVETHRTGVKVVGFHLIGVKEPDGKFYYLPDHVELQ